MQLIISFGIINEKYISNDKIKLEAMKTNLLTTILLFLIISTSFSQNQNKEEINLLLDNWHLAASNADQQAYFDAIADDGVYIGTDATEIWTKQEFFEWSKQYFEKGKAWSFKANIRNIYFTEDSGFAWFDELLEFSAGVFRGSGVLYKTADGWKIKHYVLSLPVPNEKFNDVMDAMKTEAVENPEKEE